MTRRPPDLGAEPLRALLASTAEDAIAQALDRLPDAVLGKLADRIADRVVARLGGAQASGALLTSAEAGRLTGRTPDALRMMCAPTEPGGPPRRPDVAAARVGRGRGMRWDRKKLLEALGSEGLAPKLRAGAGGGA